MDYNYNYLGLCE